jgi:hypothetical protein
MFAAAIPGQRGDHHVNEHGPAIARFAEHDFQCFDHIRPLVWLNSDIATWYHQNIMLFLRSPRVPEIDGDDWHGMPFVHPEYFNLARERPSRARARRAPQRHRDDLVSIGALSSNQSTAAENAFEFTALRIPAQGPAAR